MGKIWEWQATPVFVTRLRRSPIKMRSDWDGFGFLLYPGKNREKSLITAVKYSVKNYPRQQPRYLPCQRLFVTTVAYHEGNICSGLPSNLTSTWCIKFICYQSSVQRRRCVRDFPYKTSHQTRNSSSPSKRCSWWNHSALVSLSKWVIASGTTLADIREGNFLSWTMEWYFYRQRGQRQGRSATERGLGPTGYDNRWCRASVTWSNHS